MSDVVYSVEVQYLSKGNLFGGLNASKGALTGSVRDLEKSLTKTMSGFGKSLGEQLNSAFTTFFALSAMRSAVGAGMEFMKTGLVGMNAELEQMGITMATMFSAHGNVANFRDGIEASKELISIMRKDARDLPGEFKDMSIIMARMTTPALNSGLSIRETETLGANAMALGVGSGMQADIVGREMGALIQGQMRKQMPLLKVLPNFNVSSSEFNSMPIEKRVQRLKQALGMIDGTIEQKSISSMKKAFNTSWVGIMSTLKDQLKQVAGLTTSHLFDRIKPAFHWIGDQLQRMQEDGRLTEWAGKIGWYMARGFTAAFHMAARIAPLVERMGRFIAKEADSGKLLGDLGKLAGVLAALKAGSMVAPVAANLAPHIMGVGGEALAGIGGAVGATGAAAALGGLAIVLGAVAAAATLVYGAFSSITNEGSPLHDIAVATWHGIKASVVTTVVELSQAFATMWPALRRIAEIMGSGMLVGLELFADTIASLAIAFNEFVQGVASIADRLREILKERFPGFPSEWFDPDKKTKHLIDKPEQEYHGRGWHPSDLDNQVKTPPSHTTNIHHVEIKVVSNQDPNRVAKATADVLLDLKRNPKVALLSGQPQVIR